MLPDGRKMKLLLVMYIFEAQTDEKHRLSADKVAEKVNAMLNEKGIDDEVEVHATRKGIYDDIEAINEYYRQRARGEKEEDYPQIVKGEGRTGWYLTSCTFSTADVQLMVDAVEASKYLPEKRTRHLIGALEKLCPHSEEVRMHSGVVIFDRVKSMNTEIHDSLITISEAISENRQIRFKYFNYDYRKEKVYYKALYQVSPYDLIYTEDNYYLVAYDGLSKKKGRRTYRIDRMECVEAIPQGREGREEFGDPRKMKLHLQKSAFRMYDGEVERVTMIFRKNIMSAIMDKFGNDVGVAPVDEEHYQVSVDVAISPQFYGWVFGLGNYITITRPEKVRKEMARKLEQIRKRYD